MGLSCSVNYFILDYIDSQVNWKVLKPALLIFEYNFQIYWKLVTIVCLNYSFIFWLICCLLLQDKKESFFEQSLHLNHGFVNSCLWLYLKLIYWHCLAIVQDKAEYLFFPYTINCNPLVQHWLHILSMAFLAFKGGYSKGYYEIYNLKHFLIYKYLHIHIFFWFLHPHYFLHFLFLFGWLHVDIGSFFLLNSL